MTSGNTDTHRPMTDDELSQVVAWYADPIRRLPRKVRRDIPRLVATARARRDQVDSLRKREEIITDMAEALGKSDDTGPEGWLADRERCKPAALSGARLRAVYDHLAALVPVVHNGATRRVRERHHAILAELSRLLP